MVKSELNVSITRHGRNLFFYGDIKRTTRLSDICEADYDKRDEIAPCGVKVSLPLNTEDASMTIECNRYHLEHFAESDYYVLFNIENVVYELSVNFDGDEISLVYLSEWSDYGSFEDGDDADHVYKQENSDITFEAFDG